VTGYVYGVSVASGSAFASNDIMAATQYPDRVTGLPSASDAETYTVNALGERLSFTDRAGSTHAYTRDIVGRQTADTVVTLGAGVNGDIRRIEVAYETLGQAQTITSFDAVTGGTAKNQVARTFAAFGKIASEAQAHKGLVDASTPRVQYIWSQGSLNTDRLTKTIYPDGAEVAVNYTGLDSNMSRITSLSGVRAGTGSSVVLEALKYLGASTVIERSRPEVNVNFSLVGSATAPGDAGDKYTGLDRFGRVTDLRWIQGTAVTSPSVERLGYTYDRNTAFSETYTHDALNQLESFERGATGSPSATQDWQFDALGNWTTVTTDGIAETREANAQNELTTVGGSSLAYSATGNLTTDAEGRTLEYDAWNRLVRVTSADSFTTTEYVYNGLNHRITEVSHTGSTRDLFYSLGWQVLEERVRDGAGEIPSVADTRYIWSPVYIDAMVARDKNADNDTGTGSAGLEQRIYAIQDANWNTTAIIAASGVPGAANGNVINRFVYSPYGVSQTLTASWTTAASPLVTVWNHLFQGLKFTETTGLAYVRHRDYSATLGRFIERDPIGYVAGDNNWYRFVANGPTGSTDPSGLMFYIPPAAPTPEVIGPRFGVNPKALCCTHRVYVWQLLRHRDSNACVAAGVFGSWAEFLALWGINASAGFAGGVATGGAGSTAVAAGWGAAGASVGATFYTGASALSWKIICDQKTCVAWDSPTKTQVFGTSWWVWETCESVYACPWAPKDLPATRRWNGTTW
jgi:RHS repeat-associated protein